jgi:hypothetical protein
VVVVEDPARVVEIEVVLGHPAPGQREDPVEVGADDAVLGRGRRQLLQAPQLASGRAVDLLGQLELVEPGAQLVDLRLLLVGLAELLLNRLQLLTQEVLALALLHLGLDLRLDLRAELEHLQLAVEDARDPAQALLHVGQLEQLLLLLRLDAHRRGHQVAERARVVDVRGRQLQLLREVRDQRDDAREEALDVPRQRLDLGCARIDVGHVLEFADQVGLARPPLGDPDPAQALNEHAQGPVRNADQLVHRGGGPDLVEVVPARLLDLRAAHGHERELAVGRHDLVDQLDRALLADRERSQRVGEDDRLLQRQDRELRHGFRTWITTLPERARGFVSGKTTFSRPRS